MGYWSIFASVDSLDVNCDYAVPMDVDVALRTAEQVLRAPGRVVCERLPDGSVQATTTKHTPAWVLAGWLIPPVGLVLTFAVRLDRVASVTATPSVDGAVLHARGRLDTAAATRLRSLRAA